MSKKSLGWRTMLVVPELETELRTLRHCTSTMRVRIAACLPHAAANESASGHAFKHPSADSRRPTPLKRRQSQRKRAPSECHSHTAWHTRCAHSLQLRRLFCDATLSPHGSRDSEGGSLRQWRTVHDGSASHQAAGWSRAILLGPPLATTRRSCGCRGASGFARLRRRS